MAFKNQDPAWLSAWMAGLEASICFLSLKFTQLIETKIVVSGLVHPYL